MAPKINRRQFLQMGAAATTALVISGCTLNLQRTETLESYNRPPEDELPGENLWYASACRECGAGCGIVVRVSNGRARKIEGLPEHPVNQGRLCARGQALLQELYDPDRLRGAVRQQEGRGTHRFSAVTWETALGLLTERLQAAPEGSVAFLGGHTPSHLAVLADHLQRTLGGRPPVILTQGDGWDGRAALATANENYLGASGLPYFDLGNADAVFSFGANFLEHWLSPVHFSREYGKLRRGPLGRRGLLVQFEPRMSSTAASADAWIPIHPGTEGLIAMALGRLIMEQGRAKSPLATEFYAAISIAEVAEASGVPLDTLERIARLFGAAQAPLAIPGHGALSQRGGLENLRAILSLNRLLDRLNRPGGVYLSPQPDREGFNAPAPPRFSDLQTMVGDMAAGRIKVLLIHGANPLFDWPPGLGFAEALAGVPLVVSFSSAVDETALQADLVLPDHTSLESWGYTVPALADRVVISSLQPVMRPLYDTRATADVLLAMARAVGGNLGQALPWNNEIDYLKAATAAWNTTSAPADRFWSEWRRKGGWWEPAPTLRPVQITPAFDSPLIPNPPAVEDDPVEYAFHLKLYPSTLLGDGRGANKPWLQEVPDPMTTVSWQTWIEIHPETAASLGVQDGDVVRVLSRAGEVEALVYLYPAIRPDVVAMPLGRGHTSYGRYAKDYGSNPIGLLPPGIDPASGSLIWNGTRVRIERTGRRRELSRLESPLGVEYRRKEHWTETEDSPESKRD